MGTSRTRRAIYTPFIADAFGDRGRDIVIWDAAFVGKGPAAKIIYLEALIERHKIKKIYLQYVDSNRWRRKKPHPRFPRYAKLRDLLFSPLQHYDFPSRLQLRSSMLTKKLNHTLIQLLKGYPRFGSYPPDRLYDESPPRYINPVQLLRNHEEMVAMEKPRSWNSIRGLNKRSAFFLKRFLRKTRKLGIEVILYDIPRINMKPLTEDHMERVKSQFASEYVTFYSLIDKTTDYGDTGHLNIRGAIKFGPAIANQQ